MAFNFNLYKTPLHNAVENQDIIMIRLLLNQPKIDVNCRFILDLYFFIAFNRLFCI